MTSLDPAKFEDKYVHYFRELETAYRSAFETMNERYDSELVHAIDQQVLNESEPVYDPETGFRVELPGEPIERVRGVLASDEKIEATLDAYIDELEAELRRAFDLEP